MNPILLAVLVAAALAVIAGVILAVASIVFAVPKDEKADALRECLPGANCGACGYSGCDGYAAAMASGEAKVGLCSPGGEEVAKATGALLGVEASAVKKAAHVRCSGCDQMAEKSLVYQGVPSCAAAAKFFGGDKACAYGCLGYGDCVSVCQYDALRIENGIAVVDRDKCTGCGMCAAKCPKALIAVSEVKTAAIVSCRSHDKGAVARKACKAACIGCMKCQKVCESDAIHVTNFLAEVDPEKCTACGKCVEACPQHCIEML
ncbi:MAG: RnfABCDGE type electron transport complex subunit B [Clostridia bacterium]|nr:RnfABCDGE type electron transport complex subunit B [Clostridia bacterium]